MIRKKQLILSLVLLSGLQMNHLTHIVYQVGFEEKDPFPSYLNRQTATPYAIQIVESPVYHGSKAARFELRDTDPEIKNGTRAEISFPKPHNKTSLERWYAFAVFFPRNNFDFDSRDEVISQWHQGGKASPSLSIRTKANRIRFLIKPAIDKNKWIDLGAIEKNVWRYYVIHVIHSSGGDGLVELWRDGALLVHHTGANMYDVNHGVFHMPNWKLGIYKPAWNGSSVTKSHKRVLYFDSIKMGNEHASRSDMIVHRKN